jgi:hypothetical protein
MGWQDLSPSGRDGYGPPHRAASDGLRRVVVIDRLAAIRRCNPGMLVSLRSVAGNVGA